MKHQSMLVAGFLCVVALFGFCFGTVVSAQPPSGGLTLSNIEYIQYSSAADNYGYIVDTLEIWADYSGNIEGHYVLFELTFTGTGRVLPETQYDDGTTASGSIHFTVSWLNSNCDVSAFKILGDEVPPSGSSCVSNTLITKDFFSNGTPTTTIYISESPGTYAHGFDGMVVKLDANYIYNKAKWGSNYLYAYYTIDGFTYIRSNDFIDLTIQNLDVDKLKHFQVSLSDSQTIFGIAGHWKFKLVWEESNGNIIAESNTISITHN